MLYTLLTDKAWEVVSEALEPEEIATDDGVESLMALLRQAFGKHEVLYVGEVLDEFFEKTRRQNGEEFRPFTNRFRATLSRMRKIGVELPDCVVAYFFLRRSARLTLAQRQHVLTTCLNKYEGEAVMDACCIQFPSVANLDRQGATERPKRQVSVSTVAQASPMTAAPAPDSATNSDDELDATASFEAESEVFDSSAVQAPPEMTKEASEAFAAFRSAKQRLRQAAQARGFYKPDSSARDPRAQARLQEVKARTLCSSCQQRGH